MRHKIYQQSLTVVANAKRTGFAALLALIATAAAAPPAVAMPAGGYEDPEPTTCTAAIPACGYYGNLSAPTLATSDPTTRTIELRWSAPSWISDAFTGPTGVTGYIVERKLTSSTGSFAEVVRLGENARNYTDRELAHSTSYDYRVTTTGSTRVSNVATARTLVALTPPLLSASNATTRTVDLRWSATTGATGYAVERRETSTPGTFVTVANLDGAARGYTDSGLAHSTRYDYRVRPTGVAGSDPSNIVPVGTLPPQVERVWLATNWNEQYRFEVGSASISAPTGAKILGVRNVSLDRNNLGLTVMKVEHQSSDLETRSLPDQLNHNATTTAFNGQLAKGSWTLRVTNTSAPFLWECHIGGNWSSSACRPVANVALDVTWA